MSLIPQNYKNAVVSIGIKIEKDKIFWNATGFFVVRQTCTDKVRPFLITNKHVVDGFEILYTRMKEKNTNNFKVISLPLYDEQNKFIPVFHDKANIDIAVIPLDGSFIEKNNLEFPSFDIDFNAYTSSELRKNGFDDGSSIFMLGFPLGLVNQKSLLPICRNGIISRMSKEQIDENNNILVDIQNFPGNSGSPVISKPEFICMSGTQAFGKSVLVGIIHSYIPFEYQLKNMQTNEIDEVRHENSGIALLHPTEFIRDIIDKILPKK